MSSNRLGNETHSPSRALLTTLSESPLADSSVEMFSPGGTGRRPGMSGFAFPRLFSSRLMCPIAVRLDRPISDMGLTSHESSASGFLRLLLGITGVAVRLGLCSLSTIWSFANSVWISETRLDKYLIAFVFGVTCGIAVSFLSGFFTVLFSFDECRLLFV